MTVRSSGRTGRSKSFILKGMQCQRALWLASYPPDFEFPANPENEARLTVRRVAEALHARVRVIFGPVEGGAGAHVAETLEGYGTKRKATRRS